MSMVSRTRVYRNKKIHAVITIYFDVNEYQVVWTFPWRHRAQYGGARNPVQCGPWPTFDLALADHNALVKKFALGGE